MFSNKKSISLILFFIVLFTAYFISTNQRLKQFDTWKANKAVYFVENYPAMTTLDSFIWLRHAKEYNNGKFIIGEDDKYRYAFDFGSKNKFPIPLLSWLLAKLSGFTNGNYYMAGIYLIPFLAGLFIIPLGIYFYILGTPAAGILGGLIGTFSYVYYVRSCTGRVDTDSLNLFFPFLASLLILLSFNSKNKKNEYIFASLTGLSMALFYWWYAKPGFTIIFFVTMLAMLIIKNYKDYKSLVISAVLFIVFSNPLWFFEGISNLMFIFGRYFSLSNSSDANFPNILKTITEAQHTSVKQILFSLLGTYQVAIIGLILFLVSIPFKWKKLLPILPVFALGLLTFKSSNRFGMFLAPFIGIGLGFWLDYLWRYIDKKDKIQFIVRNSISYTLIFIIFFALSGSTAFKFIPRPSIEAPIFSSFIDLRKKIDKKSAIYTWWDYGYAIEDVADLPTYHDGGNQHKPKTYFIAKGLVIDNQNKLYNSIKFFEQKGMKDINNSLENGKKIQTVIDDVFNYKSTNDNETNNTIILFTRDMIGKYGAFSYVGNWNFEKNNSKPSGYNQLMCYEFKNNILKCNNSTVDLNKGVINGNIPIFKSIFVKNGKIIANKEYGFNRGYIFESISWNNGNLFLLTNKDVFNSNFNQMFLLGNYDESKFKEIYNKFPFARAFEVIN